MKTFTRDSLQRMFDGQGRQSSGGSTDSSAGFSYWKLDENGRLYTEYDVYSQKGISALGAGSQEGGGILGPLLTSLNSENMPPAAGYLHWTGSAWEWSTPSGGGGGGTEFDEAAMWQALDSSNSNQINASHLADALSGYATQSWIGSNYLSKNGGSMNVSTLVTNLNANYLQGRALTSGNNVTGGIPYITDAGVMEIGKYIDFHAQNSGDFTTRLALNSDPTPGTVYLPATGGTLALTSDISNSLTGIFSALSSSAATKLSITVGDTTRTLTTLYASSSDQLTTARTLWGRSFNGSANITGTLDSVHNVVMDGWIQMANNTALQMKDSGGTLLSLLTLNSGNVLAIGYGPRTSGYTTRLYGGHLEFYSNNVMTASTNTDGLWTFTKGIYLQGGTRTSSTDYSCIRIGDGMIVWDSTNNALKVIKADGSNANFYATGGVSALGAGNGQIETLQVGTLELTSAAKISANSSNEITLTSTGLKLSDNTSKQLFAVDSTGALTIGSSTQGGNLYIYYNGRRYQLNISQAIANGILS